MRFLAVSSAQRRFTLPLVVWGIGLCLATGIIPLVCLSHSIPDGDESIHTLIAQQLAFEHGPSLFARLRGVLYAQKPPLIHNVMAMVVRVCGDHNWSYRIPSAILFYLSCLILYWSGRRLFRGDRRIAFLAVTILLGSSTALRSSHSLLTATPEPWLFLASTIGLLGGYRCLSQEQVRWVTAAILPLSIALGTMVKWSAGLFVVIPVGAIVLLRWVSATGVPSRALSSLSTRRVNDSRDPLGGDSEDRLRVASVIPISYQPPSPLVTPWLNLPRLFLLVAIGLVPVGSLILVWVWCYPEFFFSDVLDNTAQRLLVKGFHHTSEPFLYLQKLMRGAYVPIWLFLLGVVGSVRLLREKTNPDHFSLVYLLCWWLIPLVLFSLLKSRNTWYYLPATPGLLLFVSAGIVHLADTSRLTVVRRIIPLGVGALNVMLICGNLRFLMNHRSSELDRLVSSVVGRGQTIRFEPSLKRRPDVVLRDLPELRCYT